MDGTTTNLKIVYADNGVIVKHDNSSVWVFDRDGDEDDKKLISFLGECIFDILNESDDLDNEIKEHYTKTGEVSIGAEVKISIKPMYSKNASDIRL